MFWNKAFILREQCEGQMWQYSLKCWGKAIWRTKNKLFQLSLHSCPWYRWICSTNCSYIHYNLQIHFISSYNYCWIIFSYFTKLWYGFYHKLFLFTLFIRSTIGISKICWKSTYWLLIPADNKFGPIFKPLSNEGLRAK